jgi:predicted DNA-binding protein with PD1-like motif
MRVKSTVDFAAVKNLWYSEAIPAMKSILSLDKPLKAGRHFLIRLPYEADIIEYLTGFCAEKKIHCAAVNLIGATSMVTIGYYSQESRKYYPKTFEQEMEIVSCSGSVSRKDGKPFLHLHAVMGDVELKSWGGHLFPGSKVFACEAHIQELKGGRRVRMPDPQTGLALWCRQDAGIS